MDHRPSAGPFARRLALARLGTRERSCCRPTLDEGSRAAENMYIFAGTNDNTFSASGPFLFTASDLKKLRPGQVLVDNNTGRESDPPTKTITLSRFDAIDCTQYG